jgi:hypothetical protein
VTGEILWSKDGTPFADALLLPSVELWSNASGVSPPVPLQLQLQVLDGTGTCVANASGDASMMGGGATLVWFPSSPLSLPGAALWHVVEQVGPQHTH